jgi:hypothetical protein
MLIILQMTLYPQPLESSPSGRVGADMDHVIVDTDTEHAHVLAATQFHVTMERTSKRKLNAPYPHPPHESGQPGHHGEIV